MQKAGKIILFISVIINMFLMILFLRPSKTFKPVAEEYLHKIDSLEQDIDSLQNYRDSIKSKIDTVYLEIAANNESYKAVRDSIINMSVTDDYLYFTSYLERNRHLSDNNPSPIKGN